MKSYEELLQERQNLEQQLQEARKREVSDAIAEARALIAKYELKPTDLFSARRGVGSRTFSSEPKYRDPATGKTWTGRGKPPAWIQGQDRGKFEI